MVRTYPSGSLQLVRLDVGGGGGVRKVVSVRYFSAPVEFGLQYFGVSFGPIGTFRISPWGRDQ